MTAKEPPFQEKLSKYLGLGSHERAHREARLVWKEAASLLKVAEWRAMLSTEAFFALFHPYAESSKAVRKLLHSSGEVWLFAATIGSGIERRSREYIGQKEAFRGYMLDRMGSFLVEEQIRRIDKRIVRKCAEKGLKTTIRYSPGYRDFALEAQEIFVKLASEAIPELRLTPGCLLFPEKTVTAIKGVLLPSSVPQ